MNFCHRMKTKQKTHTQNIHENCCANAIKKKIHSVHTDRISFTFHLLVGVVAAVFILREHLCAETI